MAKNKGTMAKVGETIKGAATTVVQAADDFVVQPVGRAVGLIGDRPAKAKKPRHVRPARRPARAAAGPAKRKTAAGKMMSESVAKTLAKPAAPTQSPGKKTPPRKK